MENVEEKSLDPNTMEQFPNFEHIKSLKLQKPGISKRYGNPNNPEVMEWYKAGNTYPHESVHNDWNKIFKRGQMQMPTSTPSGSSDNANFDIRINQSSHSEVEFNQFYSRVLQKNNRRDKAQYNTFPFYHNKKFKGKLYIQRSSFDEKWTCQKYFPNIRKTPYPPIFIPSSGRWETALLDLSNTGMSYGSYIQIVLIKEEEEENYANLIRSYQLLCNL